MDFKKEAKGKLIPALRQHQHNDCSGLIMAYDYETTLDIVSGILEQRQETRPHETIVMLWNTGKPDTDDEGDSVDVLGVIETPKNKIKTVFPIRLCGYEWYWVESGKRISDEFKVVKWMHYPTT